MKTWRWIDSSYALKNDWSEMKWFLFLLISGVGSFIWWWQIQSKCAFSSSDTWNVIQIYYFIPRPDCVGLQVFHCDPVHPALSVAAAAAGRLQEPAVRVCMHVCVRVLPASCEESERSFPPQSAAPGPAQGRTSSQTRPPSISCGLLVPDCLLLF